MLPEDAQALLTREVTILRQYEKGPRDPLLQVQAEAAAEKIAQVVTRHRRPDLL
jgi:hypothetical protein